MAMELSWTWRDNGSNDLGVILCSVFMNPICWWAAIFLALFLIERYQLGTHCFSWPNGAAKNKIERKTFMNGTIRGLDTTDGKCVNGMHHSKDIQIPYVFHKFVRTKVMSQFQLQCQSSDNRFAVLVFSRIKNLMDIEKVDFKQITFNGRSLVDSRLSMYPQDYRFENYVVARLGSRDTEHPESLITEKVPLLLSAYGRSERCYLRETTPKFAILYCWAMPCIHCTQLIIKSLSGVCSKGVVVAYSNLTVPGGGGKKEGEKSHQLLTDAGFIVVNIRSQ